MKFLLCFAASCLMLSSVAQNVGIGTATPNASAQLDVTSTARGILIPRINLLSPTDVVTVSAPATGLLVYNSNATLVQMPDGVGFYYWNGAIWLKIITTGSATGSGWLTTGNAGISATNFIGTSDNQMLRFRVNNIPSGFIDPNSTNSAFGIQSLSSLTSGAHNSGYGWHSLMNNTTGNANTSVGIQGLLANTVGAFNTVQGYSGLASNVDGNSNTGMGMDILYSNTDGYSNVAMGALALFNNQHGSNLVAIGDSALFNNIGIPGFLSTGSYNTAIGSKALFSNVSGSSNTAVGFNAMYGVTSGGSNVGIGMAAMADMQTGGGNIAIGRESLSSAISGNDNIVIGSSAMPYSAASDRNHAIGTLTLTQITSGHDNVAIGYRNSYNLNTGSLNTAIGVNAIENTSSALRNTAVGSNAGKINPNGNWCTFVGASADANGSSYSNSTALGDGSTITGSNQVRVGDGGVTSIGGQVGWTTLSDARFKINVQENIPGLDFIMKLHPVSYQYNRAAINQFLRADNTKNVNSSIDQMRFTGMLAQEVEATAKSLGFDFSGVDKPKNENDTYGLRYAEFVGPLIKAVQEQQQQIADLKTQNELLEKRLRALEEKIK